LERGELKKFYSSRTYTGKLVVALIVLVIVHLGVIEILASHQYSLVNANFIPELSATPSPMLTPSPSPNFEPTATLAPTSNPTPAPTIAPATGVLDSNTPNLGVYSDSLCTKTATSLSFGTISPRESATVTFYVKNKGNNDLTLSLQITNWNPSTANGPLTVTWNLENTVLSANQVSAATLTLYVSPNIQGITTFSFDSVISGTQ
jgi:hypothetical protein